MTVAVFAGMELSVNWDALAAVATLVLAFVAFLSVLVALFGQWVNERWRRPRLVMTFNRQDPFCRYTLVNWPGGARKAYWARVRVTNEGVSPALGLRGKLVAIRTDGTQRFDVDPMALRWAGVPDALGFDPIVLARGQHEYLNVAYVVQGESEIQIPTFPGFAPGHRTTLEPNREHKLEISVFADNAEPMTTALSMTYRGDVDTLDVSLADGSSKGKRR